MRHQNRHIPSGGVSGKGGDCRVHEGKWDVVGEDASPFSVGREIELVRIGEGARMARDGVTA